MKQLDQTDMVLVRTSHPGNIGAAARALKTMGLNNLVLVNPKQFPHAEAQKRSAGAEDVLDSARVETSLESALSRASLVFGTSARPREVNWPMLTPRAAAEQAAAKPPSKAPLLGAILVLFLVILVIAAYGHY